MAGESGTDASGKKPGGGKRGADRGDNPMSQALRTAYQRTVEEDVPDEMLDLLRKLD